MSQLTGLSKRSIASILSVLMVVGNLTSSLAYANSLPSIVHSPPAEAVSSAKPFPLSAVVTDDAGVDSVTLYYRLGKSKEFLSQPMVSDGNDIYSYTFPTSDLIPPSIDYYIEAVDTDGEKQLRGFDFDPLVFTVTTPIVEETVANNGKRKLHPAVYIVGGLPGCGTCGCGRRRR